MAVKVPEAPNALDDILKLIQVGRGLQSILAPASEQQLTPYQQAQLALKLQPSNIELKTVGSESNLIRFNPNTGEMENIDLPQKPKRLSPKDAKTFIHDELDSQLLSINGLYGISKIMNQETGEINKDALLGAVAESSKGFESITNPQLFQGIINSYVRGFDKKFNDNARTKFNDYIKNQTTLNDNILSHRTSLDNLDIGDEEREAVKSRIEQLEAQKNINQSLYQPFISVLDLRANLETPSERKLTEHLHKQALELDKSYLDASSLGKISENQQKTLIEQENIIEDLTAELKKAENKVFQPKSPKKRDKIYDTEESGLYRFQQTIEKGLIEKGKDYKKRQEAQIDPTFDIPIEEITKLFGLEGRMPVSAFDKQVQFTPFLELLGSLVGEAYSSPDTSSQLPNYQKQETIEDLMNYMQDQIYIEQASKQGDSYSPRY